MGVVVESSKETDAVSVVCASGYDQIRRLILGYP
jgi:hypothetical protein